ncbi:MAG: Tol-Pal system protein TolB [Sphingomonas sp.]|nr:Tol-Pal system protein TolB [Sphingomonas sp.]RZV51018.1 MAG: Tol-Pal system protein TolB [Sphingomonadaceae bacterium]
MFKFLTALLLLLVPAAAFAQEPPPLEVDVVGGQQGNQPVAVPAMAGDSATGRNISAVIASDLRFTGVLSPIGPTGIRGLEVGEVTRPDHAYWRRAGATALVSGQVDPLPGGRIQVSCYLFDTVTRLELERQGYAVDAGDWRRAAHRCADMVYSRLTGEQPFLDTRIVYVAETGPKNNRVKRIALMDSDGSNHRYLTDGSYTVVTPRFSPDGRRLVYMSYKGRRPRARIMDLATGQDRLLVPGTAFTFAPRFSPDGRNVVFSMGTLGNSDIYVVSVNGSEPRRLTTAGGVDTSPSYSPDGRRIVFESDRSGSQQLYVMDADGSQQRRISFGGGQYASPAWSPRGDLIAYTRIGGGAFRIGIMNPSGRNARLLTNSWQDEGPSWAPNGQFVMFHRTRQGSGEASLYAVPINGGQPRLMPTPLGGSDPSWSPLKN